MSAHSGKGFQSISKLYSNNLIFVRKQSIRLYLFLNTPYSSGTGVQDFQVSKKRNFLFLNILFPKQKSFEESLGHLRIFP